VLGVNDGGEVSGQYTDGDGAAHGFLLQGSTYSFVDLPNAVNTYGAGMNNARQVVGTYSDDNGVTHDFLAAAWQCLRSGARRAAVSTAQRRLRKMWPPTPGGGPHL
jgi:hypothetical protein